MSGGTPQSMNGPPIMGGPPAYPKPGIGGLQTPTGMSGTHRKMPTPQMNGGGSGATTPLQNGGNGLMLHQNGGSLHNGGNMSLSYTRNSQEKIFKIYNLKLATHNFSYYIKDYYIENRIGSLGLPFLLYFYLYS